MKRLCFGTMLKILYCARANSVTQVKLVERLFAAFEISYPGLNRPTANRFINGPDNPPIDLINAARDCDKERLVENFHNLIIPLLNALKLSAIVKAIQNVIEEDDKIALDDELIGFAQNYEKIRIIQSDSFELSSLLSNLFYFVILNTKNTDQQKSIKEITKEYLDSLEAAASSIQIEQYDINHDKSSKNKNALNSLRKVFIPYNDDPIIKSLPNKSTIELYYANFRNGKFKFKGLESIIIESITSYVESKERIRSSNASNTGTQLGSSAAIKFMKASTKNIDVFLGEMLLYLFLEQELGAPKIMSKIEIDEVSGSLKSASEGIHLLAAPNCDDFQLVCGASEIHGDLNNAANRAFEKVELIIDNEENEFAFVSNADFDREFPTKIRKYLVDELVPEERKEVKANLSFGILLGYTANVDLSGLDYSQYNNALEKQIIADLTHLKSYISDLVQASGYEGYSFYVFVVPFNDADIEKKELIENLFGR